jgi:hypothetical protein
MMIARRPNRSVVTAARNSNHKNNKRVLFDEDSTIASDNSSLGSKIQIPQAFLQKPLSSKRPTPTAFFPPSGHFSSSPSKSRVREETNVHRLLIQAKRHQEASTMRGRHPYDARMAQSMSVKLPAYHQASTGGPCTTSTSTSSSTMNKKNASSQQQQQPLSRPVFRGKKSWTSSAAAGSFAASSRPSNTTTTRSHQIDQNKRSSSCNDDEKKGWRSWLARFSSTKSTLVHV